jgi:hypothetical protein
MRDELEEQLEAKERYESAAKEAQRRVREEKVSCLIYTKYYFISRWKLVKNWPT